MSPNTPFCQTIANLELQWADIDRQLAVRTSPDLLADLASVRIAIRNLMRNCPICLVVAMATFGNLN